MIFGRKVKEEDKKEIARIQATEDRLWKLENPPDKNVGDKIIFGGQNKHGVIVDILFVSPQICMFGSDEKRFWEYRVYSENDKKTYTVTYDVSSNFFHQKDK